jgi:hypothetical protein
MGRADLELAGLVDADGESRAYFEHSSQILVPPKVELMKQSKSTPIVQYPVPELWSLGIRVHDTYILDKLQSVGWTLKTESNRDTLLTDFTALQTTDSILEFAKAWGPLWLCRAHQSCLWTPRSAPTYNDCVPFVPTERVRDYRLRARHAKWTLEILSYVKQGVPAPVESFYTVNTEYGCHPDERSELRRQRTIISSVITYYLSAFGGPRFRVEWSESHESYNPAKLQIYTGLGVLRVIWLQLAQLACDSTSLITCSGCGRIYPRRVKKAQKQRSNYCGDCGVRAAKRAWASRNRSKRKPSHHSGLPGTATS